MVIVRVALWAFAILSALSGIGRAAMVGQPRPPVTPGAAVFDLVGNGSMAVVLIYVATQWGPS